MMSNLEYELPEFMSEIHFGFLSGKHYIGRTEVSHCTKIEIAFDGNTRQWRIRVEWADKNGSVKVSEKTYNNRLREFGIHEKQIPPNIAKE
ncbi:MAG: hypothetical protein J1E85_10680 [Ruminococcus sp.]|nr:hypothetical protein [Ruminococcus sp.]